MTAPVIFFDDLCVLCSRSVRFIYKNDRKHAFYFASMNSQAYGLIKSQFNDDKLLPDSVVLLEKGKVYTRSGAALRIAHSLRFPLPLLGAAFIFPRILRDAVYNWIARNRYSWFGKRNYCFTPDKGLKERFLD